MKEKYYQSKESVQEYISMAKDVNGGELIEKLQQYLHKGSTVLEIGSGPGTDWKMLKEQYDATGSDYSKEFLNHLIQAYPEGHFLELDAVSLKTEDRFDGIYSNKVLHHLNDTELIQTIKRQTEILNPMGVICHSFWKGQGSEIFKGLFVNYHDQSSLEKLFGRYFNILTIEEYKEFEENDSLLLIGKKL
ncbi:MAG: class I SAM-dependent methyltransferase [Reichenbachiella sp.]